MAIEHIDNWVIDIRQVVVGHIEWVEHIGFEGHIGIGLWVEHN
jgi:hypothetical protein